MFKICYYANSKANRNNNEDKFQINKYHHNGEEKIGKKIIGNNSLVTVSDGMGGESYGELASEIVTKELSRIYNKKITISNIKEQINNINNLVVSEMNIKKCRIGATLVSAIIGKKNISIINVGDSRAYLYTKKLIQITKDHAIKDGLTQHMGMTLEDGLIDPFIIENINVNKNDYLILCSDGLYNMVSNEEIENILSSKIKDYEKCKLLLETAIKNGGKDNVTLILIKF